MFIFRANAVLRLAPDPPPLFWDLLFWRALFPGSLRARGIFPSVFAQQYRLLSSPILLHLVFWFFLISCRLFRGLPFLAFDALLFSAEMARYLPPLLSVDAFFFLSFTIELSSFRRVYVHVPSE